MADVKGQVDWQALSDLQPIIDWLENAAEDRMKSAIARQPREMRNATLKELKVARKMAEKMAGHKFKDGGDLVEENQRYCNIQDRIIAKLEGEAMQLAAWADKLSALRAALDDLPKVGG